MAKRATALLLCLMLVGCTRVVDTARPLSATPVAPITSGQVGDLLSKDAQRGDDGNLFVTVEPETCAGVAREVDPPFIFDLRPAAHDGGHWDTSGVYIEEMVGVYRADFESNAALTAVRNTIDSCRGQSITITALDGEVDAYRLLPQADSGSPDIVIWSFQTARWACDNVFTAAHNAAIEITACATTNGYDVLALAKAARQRIEDLANTKL